MSVPAGLAALAGQWTGTNRLWFMPTDPAFESASTMTIALIAGGKSATLRYTWAHEGQPNDGLLLFSQDPGSKELVGTWVDSFHTGDKPMQFAGAGADASTLTIKAAYPAPPGPDWGWHITITPNADGTFRFAMYNLEPGAAPQLAVEAIYTRAA